MEEVFYHRERKFLVMSPVEACLSSGLQTSMPSIHWTLTMVPSSNSEQRQSHCFRDEINTQKAKCMKIYVSIVPVSQIRTAEMTAHDLSMGNRRMQPSEYRICSSTFHFNSFCSIRRVHALLQHIDSQCIDLKYGTPTQTVQRTKA